MTLSAIHPILRACFCMVLVHFPAHASYCLYCLIEAPSERPCTRLRCISRTAERRSSTSNGLPKEAESKDGASSRTRRLNDTVARVTQGVRHECSHLVIVLSEKHDRAVRIA
jgi:hypothetical protein